MEPLLLCVQMPPDRLMRLTFLAMKLGVRVRAVREEETGWTLAALCGLEPPRADAPRAPVPEEMLVMAFFPDALTDRLLQSIRQSGIGPVRLKAVLTAHNRAWTCGQLHAMLSREAALFSGKGAGA